MKIKKLGSAVIGIVSVILGIICYSKDAGYYQGDVTYGGDAYTGIQNAAAQTACNVKDLALICKFGFGSILLIAGLVLILYAITAKTQDYTSGFEMINFNTGLITGSVNDIKASVDKISASIESKDAADIPSVETEAE